MIALFAPPLPWAALCVLEHASSSTPPELIDHVLAGLEARTAPQPDSH